MRKIVLLISLSLFIFSCTTSKVEKVNLSNVEHPQWLSNAVIYEVNTRQFTEDGTFEAFMSHIPRLKELGVDILWFMPIHPIGVKDRKGELGSYYSIVDYKEVNPEFGTIEDFKKVVAEAHKHGMKVILDWVANHTSRDAKWLETNPEWYVMDSTTNSPVAPFDWSDVAKLNYDVPEVREAMLDAMMYWIRDIKIDGFRCDVAAEVPVDFWDYAVAKLKEVNSDIFMLAEAEEPALQYNAFNAYYGWHFHHIKNKIASGEYGIDSIRSYMKRGYTRFPSNTIPMFFTSNHDENSWNGTEFDRLGNHAKQMAVFTFVMPGMPLIYNGQEVGFNRMLEFFVKDQIDWNGDHSFTDFYRNLISFKKSHEILDTPDKSIFNEIVTDHPDKIYAFHRALLQDELIAIFNFSSEEVITFLNGIDNGDYLLFNPDDASKQQVYLKDEQTITIEPYGYRVFIKNNTVKGDG